MNNPCAEPLVLLYHGLDPGDGRYDAFDAGDKGYVISRAVFEKHLDALDGAGWCMIDPAGRFTSGSASGLCAGEVILTFDDGLRSDYDVAFGLLSERGTKALFFVNPERVGSTGRTDWNQLAEMAQGGMTIGSHGMTHRLFSSMSEKEQRQSLTVSRRTIEDRIGCAVCALSLPGGRFGSRTLNIARGCGYKAVFTSSPVPAAWREGLWIVGRVAIRAGQTEAWFKDFATDPTECLRRMRRADSIRRCAQACLGDRLYGCVHRLVWRLRGV